MKTMVEIALEGVGNKVKVTVTQNRKQFLLNNWGLLGPTMTKRGIKEAVIKINVEMRLLLWWRTPM